MAQNRMDNVHKAMEQQRNAHKKKKPTTKLTPYLHKVPSLDNKPCNKKIIIAFYIKILKINEPDKYT